MHFTIWWSAPVMVLVLLLAGIPVRSETVAAGSPDIEQQAMAALKGMADFLSQAEHLSVSVETEYDALQDSGQKLEFGATRRFTIHRPNRLRIDIEERDGSKKGVRFNGQSLSIFSADENVYATVAKSGTLDAAFAYAIDELQMPLPLTEILSSDFPKIVADDVWAVASVGESTIAGLACEHLAVRGDGVDYQVWIAEGDQPLPQRIVITYKDAYGHPQFRAQFSNWNLSPEVSDSIFAFTPPAGAEQIPFAPRLQATGDVENQ